MKHSHFITHLLLATFLQIIPIAVFSSNVKNQHINLGARSGLSKGIIFGEPALPTQLPWIAMLKIMDYQNRSWLCSAVMITPKFLLSAVHCFNPQGSLTGRAEFVEIRFNFVKLRNSNRHTLLITEHDIIKHPDFDKNELLNDICILKIPESACNFFDYDFNFPLLDRTPVEIVKHFEVAGWGMTETGGNPQSLMTVELDYLASNECNLKANYKVGNQLQNWVYNETQFCLYGDKNWEYSKRYKHRNTIRADACTGDSGGPVYSYKNGYRLNGLISFGPKNCGANIPGVYTRISSYIDWIKAVTKYDQTEVQSCKHFKIQDDDAHDDDDISFVQYIQEKFSSSSHGLNSDIATAILIYFFA